MTPTEERAWEAHAAQLVKDLMRAAQIRTYKELAAALAKIGVIEEPRALTNRINRGKFSAVLLLQCIRALGLSPSTVPWSMLEAWNPAPKRETERS